MKKKKKTGRPKNRPKGGMYSKKDIYQMLQTYGPRAVRRIARLVYSKDERIALEASKVIVHRLTPALKATQISIDGKVDHGVVVLPLVEKEEAIAARKQVLLADEAKSAKKPVDHKENKDK